MHKKFIFILFSLVFSQAFAEGPGIYFWDNQERFVEGSSCTVIPRRKNPFRLAVFFDQMNNRDFQSLMGPDGNNLSSLANYSLVKLHNVTGSSVPNAALAQVIGLSTDSNSVPVPQRSQRGDTGYIQNSGLHPIENYSFHLPTNSESLIVNGNVQAVNTTSWRLVSDTNYYVLSCDNMSRGRRYFMFEVSAGAAENKAVIAYVGVSQEETGILNQINRINLINQTSSNETLLHNQPLIESLRLTHTNPPTKNLIGSPQVDNSQGGGQSNTDDTTGDIDNTLRICTSSREGSVNIREENLEDVKFRASLGEVVTVFQDWSGDSRRTRTINGRTYTFIRVRFIEREEQDQVTGWVAESFVKRTSRCRAFMRYELGNVVTEDNDESKITSITDSDCCEFPTTNRPTHSYTSGMRRFEANRSGGDRKHAACDLYRYVNEPAVAIAPGKVVSNLYYFYEGTYAVEIEHPGGYIARYGEITDRRANGIRPGLRVTKGQRVGYIGRVNSGCCRPMLHFELYAGTMEGDLTDFEEDIYNRREDLLDPTNFLLRWQEMKF